MEEIAGIPLTVKYGTILLAVTLGCLVVVWLFRRRKKKG